MNTAGFGIQETSTIDTPDVKYRTRLRIKKKEHKIKEGDPLWKRVYKSHPGPILATALALKFGIGMTISHLIIPKFLPKQWAQFKNFSFKRFKNVMNNFEKFKRYSDDKKYKAFDTATRWFDMALIGSSVLSAIYLFTTEQYDFYFERMMEGIDQEIKTVTNIGKKKEKLKKTEQTVIPQKTNH